MGVSWIKITTSIFDDEKIKIIDSMPDHDAILVIWIKLLTLAGKCNARGCLLISDSLPYTDEMLSAVFSRPLNTVKMALGIFEQLGMICRSDAIQLVNWEKHQNEAALEIIRDNERDRKRIQRSRQRLQITDKKESPGNVPDKVPEMSHDVRILDIELDSDKDKRKREVFKQPTSEEVKAYCQERNNRIDADHFIDYYASKGWMIGKNKMKDWRAAVRTWEKNDAGKQAPRQPERETVEEPNPFDAKNPFGGEK